MNLLEKASAAVYGERQSAYGPAKQNHERIAALWSVILGKEVTWQQVIQCMVAVKLARLINTPDHEDSWLDIAGYAGAWDQAYSEQIDEDILRAFGDETDPESAISHPELTSRK